MNISRRGLSAASLALAATPALAQQDWPGRAVTLVVPWAAGGSTDAVARILAQRLSQDTQRSFVVDNRTVEPHGGNGTTGFQSDARAPGQPRRGAHRRHARGMARLFRGGEREVARGDPRAQHPAAVARA